MTMAGNAVAAIESPHRHANIAIVKQITATKGISARFFSAVFYCVITLMLAFMTMLIAVIMVMIFIVMCFFAFRVNRHLIVVGVSEKSVAVKSKRVGTGFQAK